jgi:hypothetical protein
MTLITQSLSTGNTDVQPAAPQKVNVVLRLYERYDFGRVLYKRGTVYSVTAEHAAKLLADRDENDKPTFARYVPPKTRVQAVAQTSTLPEVDLTDPATMAKAQRNDREARLSDKRVVEVGTDEELAEALHGEQDEGGVEIS